MSQVGNTPPAPPTTQSADELFGPDKTESADDFFAPPQPFGLPKKFMTAVDSFNSILGGPSTQIKGPYSGSLSDYLFSTTSAGRVMSAFGQGAKDGWGSVPSLYEAEIHKELDAKTKEQDTSIVKGFNEAFMRPASAAVDFLIKAPVAFFGGVSNALGSAGNEIGGPAGELLKDASAGALPEAHFDVAVPGSKLAPEGASRLEPTVNKPVEASQGADFATNQFGETAANPERFQTQQDYNQTIYKARAEGVIGEGEEGFFGTVEPSPEQLQTRQEFAKDAGIPLLEYKPLQVPTIDELAREVNPDAFKEADDLQALQDHLRDTLGSLRNEASEPWEKEEFDILDRVGNDISKLTPEEQNRLNYVTSQVEANKLDTPQMTEIRAKILEADFRLRDLSRDVRQARESVESLINSDSREGAAYRDYVQAKAFEVAVRGLEIQESLAETYSHAQSLYKPHTEASPGGPVGEAGPSETAVSGAPKPSGKAPEPVTFKTSKGSSYKIEQDGSTSRDKAARSDPGHEGQQGPQPKSQKTYYVTPEEADQLGLFQAQGVGRMAVTELKDGRIGVKYLEGKNAGKFEKRTVVKPKDRPAVGLVPVETWNDGQRVHFGNDITEVSEPENATIVDTQSPRSEPGDTTSTPGQGDGGGVLESRGQPGSDQSGGSVESPTDSLREIENPAGETKTRGLALSIEKEMGQKFGDLPEYTAMVRDDQFTKAAELINSDPERALRIALGQEQAPADIYPEAIFTGLKKQAKETGDVDLARKLGTESELTRSATTMGQRLNLLREDDEFDPTTIIKNLQQAREKALRPKGLDKIVSQAQKFIQKSKIDPIDSKSLLESFQCDY